MFWQNFTTNTVTPQLKRNRLKFKVANVYQKRVIINWVD